MSRLVRCVTPFALLAAGCVALASCSDPSSGTTRNGDRPIQAPPDVPSAAVALGATSPQLDQIRVAPVVAREFAVDEVVAPGRVGIDPNRISRVLLPVPGRIVDVMVKLGDAVERGQPVLAVESPDTEGALGALRQAEAGERQAEASLAKVETDQRRASELYEHRAIAQKDLLSAQNDLAQAQATLEVARAGREQARRRLEMLGLAPGAGRQPILVRSPITGKVLEISVAQGEYRNDTSAPLMTIADLGRVWITSEVPESSIRLIRVGERVAITLVAFPDEVFSGRVARIGDVLDPQTRTVKVHVEIANPLGRLRPEMFGSVRHAGAARSVPMVPLGAVVHEFGQSIVFVEDTRGRFVRREVALGPRAGEVVPVLKGLAPGDRVVVDGAVLLKER